MSFMVPEVQYTTWWRIERPDGEVLWVEEELFPQEQLPIVVGGEIARSTKVAGWGVRLTAPGYLDCTPGYLDCTPWYLDCTPWEVFDKEADARAYEADLTVLEVDHDV